MRPRRAAPALAILAAACLAAACTSDAAPSATAPPAATMTATPTPTAARTPAATPTPTPAAAPTATPTATPAPAAKRYNRLDATGEAATAGSWAILGADGSVLTTWEGLRSDAATLRLNQTDAGGASWAAEFGAVGVGDIVEWRKADDCWVRYRVTGAPTRPASGSSRQEFPVEWMTYAGTGAGCTGAVGAATVLSADEGAPGVVRTSEIASPVRHGPYLIAPASLGWAGAVEAPVRHEPPPPATGGASGASATATPSPVVITQDLAEARRLLPYWRDPVLPAGWTFSYAEAGTDNAPPPATGYCAVYRSAAGYRGATICVGYKHYRPSYTPVLRTDGSEVYETRTIDGHAALVRYSPPGPAHNRYLSVRVRIFDADTGIEYRIRGYNLSLRGSNVEAAVAITRSLIPKAGAP